MNDHGDPKNKDLIEEIKRTHHNWKQEEKLLQLLIWEAKDRGMVLTAEMISGP